MSTITTNEINYTLDYDGLSELYEVYKVTTSKEYIPTSMLDSELLCNEVCSIVYEGGSNMYILMNKHADNKKNLIEALSKSSDNDDYKYITTKQIGLRQIEKYLLLQLLLNSLGTYSESLKANNLTGHLYCFHPKWVEHKKNDKERYIAKVPTLEVRISSDYKLILEVRTFTSVRLKDRISFTEKKPFKKYLQYVYGKNNTLRRKLKGDSESGFILRQTDGVKTTIKFLSIGNRNKFEKSKMGILYKLLDTFHKTFKDLATIKLQPIPNFTSISVNNREKILKEIKQVICEYLSNNKLKIVDQVSDDKSKESCEKLRDILQSEYNVSARIVRNIDKNALNICLIHNAEYYEKHLEDDPYNKVPDGVAVQHITIEEFNFDAKYMVRKILQEILIKQDLISKKINLYDWASLNFKDKITFIMSYSDDYFCMEIKPDGNFTIIEKERTFFDYDEYNELIDIFTDDSSIRGVIKFPSGDINVIRDTSIFTIPELEQIKKELDKGNTNLRGKESRNTLLTSILDIKAYRKNEKLYYFSGVIGGNMQSDIQFATNVREVSPYEQSNILFEQILPLMNASFVRNGQLTVIPFPFKYIREYIKKQEI